MRRNRSGIFNTGQWTTLRGTPMTCLCYMFVFGIICTNLIAICVFSVILDCQTNVFLLRRSRSQSPSTSAALNDMLATITSQGSEDMIPLAVLLKILRVFKEEDIHLRHSYIDAILLYNNISVDLQWLSECSRLTFDKQVVSEPHTRHSLNVETNDRSVVLHREKRLSDSTASTPMDTNSSFGNASDKSHSSNNNPSPSFPRLKRGNQTSSSLAQNRDKANITVEPSQSDVAAQSNGTGVQDRRQPLNTRVLSGLVSCVNHSKGLVGRYNITTQNKTPKKLASIFPQLQEGGRFTPTECTPKENTAIIIPYRNRYSHLHILLLNIVPLLMKQNVKFTIFVIEQGMPGIFNRGMLFNVGFLEAQKLDSFDCFIFHDVDIIPINDFNFYHCNDQPTHFLSGVNKFKYKLMYKNMFGGVVAFTREQFKKINGASNLYFGWGGEDDDLQIRVTHKGYTVIRKYSNIGLYDMIKHSRDETNKVNPFRKRIITFAKERQDTEGLSTTVYSTQSVEPLPIYTWIKVSINMTTVLQTVPKNMQQIRNQLLKHFMPTELSSNKV